MTDINKLKEEMITACKRAYQRGIQTGSGGNISIRVPDKEQMIVKSSGASFADSTIDGFVLTDFSGNVISGTGKPTREALLHGYLYTINPKINSVIHVHAPYSIIWSSDEETLRRVTWHSQLKLCADIPVLDIPSPMVRTEDFPLIKNIMDTYPDLSAFILKNHGIVAMDRDPINAEHTAELIEETAQIAFFEKLSAAFRLSSKQ